MDADLKKLVIPSPIFGNLFQFRKYRWVGGLSHAWKSSFSFLPYSRINRYMPTKVNISIDPVARDFWKTKKNGTEKKYEVPSMGLEQSYTEAAKFWTPELEPDFDDPLLELAAKVVKNMIHSKITLQSVSSHSDAIGRFDFGKSCGAFYQNAQTKGEALSIKGVEESLIEYFERLNTDNPYWAVYNNTQKLEIRKIGKPVRTFLVGDMRLHYSCLRLYGRIMDEFVAQAGKNGWWIGVGSSHLTSQWHQLHQRLSQGSLVFASDVSGWDRNISPSLLAAGCEILNSCLNNHDRAKYKKALNNATYMLVYGYVLFENGEMVRKNGGMPSGDFRTILVNSICNWIKNVRCFLLMMENPFELQMKEILQRMVAIQMSITGDDDIGSVDEKEAPWFDRKIFRSVAQVNATQLGMVLKVLDMEEKVEKLQYLSRGFVQRKGKWVALPDRVKVINALVYGNFKKHAKFSVLKALSLRMEVWGDEQLFKEITEYCDLLRKIYAQETEIDIEDGMPSWRDIWCSYLSEDEIAVVS